MVENLGLSTSSTSVVHHCRFITATSVFLYIDIQQVSQKLMKSTLIKDLYAAIDRLKAEDVYIMEHELPNAPVEEENFMCRLAASVVTCSLLPMMGPISSIIAMIGLDERYPILIET
ncbi:hypothetical protein QJS10_CPB17g00232 [Acorus calamus]|uniref:Uncharacterized protein n=1 Tax=Acorus calamus TaxID=4465 RepID=A0AAV9CTT7_ACOCL|nr:hypothetical protein QJS10_CPB17g00232 [Acorus calamus]